MSFLSVSGEQLEIDGKNGEKFQLKAASLRVWRNFCVWTQYKPYRDSIIADLPKELQQEIYKECRCGKVIELTIPENWPDNVEPKKEDLVEREVNINPFCSVVLNQIGQSESDEKIIEFAFWDQYPKTNQKPIRDIIDVDKQQFIVFRQEYLFINGFSTREELENLYKKYDKGEIPLEESPNKV